MTEKTKSKYPSLSKLLKKKNKFNKEEIATIIVWKTKWFKGWKKRSKKEKNYALKELITNFCNTLNLDYTNIIEENKYSYTKSHDETYEDEDGEWIEDVTEAQITIDQSNPSIISTLHEIGHHIKGNSETKACQWSIQLFKQFFPKDYKNLKIQGHLLVKK